MAKIFIDVGHGGTDPGAVNGNLIEKNMNLVTAKAAAEILQKYGCDVKLSRIDDSSLSLTQRANMANNWGAELFVSCHYNAGGGDRGEVIHSVFYGKGTELAKYISAELKAIGQDAVKEYSKPSTSGQGDYYTVISATNMPAVIVEGCFIDNAQDRQIADTPEEQAAIGRAIAYGILKFLEIEVNDMAKIKVVKTKSGGYIYLEVDGKKVEPGGLFMADSTTGTTKLADLLRAVGHDVSYGEV